MPARGHGPLRPAHEPRAADAGRRLPRPARHEPGGNRRDPARPRYLRQDAADAARLRRERHLDDLRARRALARPDGEDPAQADRDRLLVVPALQRLLARRARGRLGGRDGDRGPVRQKGARRPLRRPRRRLALRQRRPEDRRRPRRGVRGARRPRLLPARVRPPLPPDRRDAAGGALRRQAPVDRQLGEGLPATLRAADAGRPGRPDPCLVGRLERTLGRHHAPAFPPPLTPSFQRRFRHPFTATHSVRHLFRIA